MPQRTREWIEELGRGLATHITLRKFCYTVRERTMIALMNSLTDMARWDQKIFDSSFVDTWKVGNIMTGQDVTRAMLDWVGWKSVRRGLAYFD